MQTIFFIQNIETISIVFDIWFVESCNKYQGNFSKYLIRLLSSFGTSNMCFHSFLDDLVQCNTDQLNKAYT